MQYKIARVRSQMSDGKWKSWLFSVTCVCDMLTSQLKDLMNHTFGSVIAATLESEEPEVWLEEDGADITVRMSVSALGTVGISLREVGYKPGDPIELCEIDIQF